MLSRIAIFCRVWIIAEPNVVFVPEFMALLCLKLIPLGENEFELGHFLIAIHCLPPE